MSSYWHHYVDGFDGFLALASSGNNAGVMSSRISIDFNGTSFKPLEKPLNELLYILNHWFNLNMIICDKRYHMAIAPLLKTLLLMIEAC